MSDANVPEGYVGVEQAAERLGVSRTKIWRLIRDGRIATSSDLLDRRRKLISIEELERLAAGRVEDMPEARRPSGNEEDQA